MEKDGSSFLVERRQPHGPRAVLSSLLLDSSPDGYLTFDQARQITYCNRRLADIVERLETEVVGRNLDDFFRGLKDGPMSRTIGGRPCMFDVRTGSITDGVEVAGWAMFRDVTEYHRTLHLLQETEQRFRIMADSAPVMLWMSDTAAECTFFNQGWLEFTGRPLEIEQGVGWAEGVHPEDLQPSMDTFLEHFVKRQPFRMEYRLRRADGEYRWILDTGVPRFGLERQFEGFIGSCIDITELKESQAALRALNESLELRVEERTAQLARYNQELQEFGTVVSHDLQEPLRTIAGHISILEKRYRGKLADDADASIQFVVDAARRMQTLIKDLLGYARLSPPRFGEVDTEEVLVQVKAQLQAALDESGALVTWDSLPRLHADGTLLRLLFQNLIVNAVKFRGEAPPRIHIGGRPARDGFELFVSDNGIGIDAEHHERIFRVFQRLHTPSEYPGSGVGLSICRKIVDLHGGRIWVESDPGQGSTFRFILPVEGTDA